MIYIRDFRADGPYELDCKINMLQRDSGVFVILHKKEDGNFNIIDIDIAEESVKDIIDKRERYDCWRKVSTSLYVAAIYLDKHKLNQTSNRLKKIYKPVCAINISN